MSKKDVNSRIEVKEKKKKSQRRKIIFFIFVPLIILIGAVSAYVINLVNEAEQVVSNSYESDGRDKSELRAQEVDPTEDHVSVLFIGVDSSEHREENGESVLSDALILATLNKNDNSVKMLSIPRDSYVYVPEVGYEDKITHAHAFGGVQATIETVESFLDIPVDYFVKLNFNAFVDVIDAIGGVEMDVPFEFTESNSDDQSDSIHLYPGEQNLDGEDALALARTRKIDNDIERGKRQQEIMKAVISKATSVNSVFKLDDAIQGVGNNMTTNLSFDEMKAFLSYGTSGSIDMDTLNLDGSDMRLNNTYYYSLDEQQLAETKQILQTHLDVAEDNTVTAESEETTEAPETEQTTEAPLQ
ncbi:transcriptional attenuator, LytR family [Gracilibacillus orientalis]|uniref:Transcriptional attenuator, LytR family n=1 Tax=Gracilibacillus orientalis TaxID=334253 RepID=A0A1I4PHN2_9BACI|nr:LCP family protein [Gracilibacillus orientalis]SFM27056.1 transcriptional attenuator, LytR family [Gracilibacillus orientalis]